MNTGCGGNQEQNDRGDAISPRQASPIRSQGQDEGSDDILKARQHQLALMEDDDRDIYEAGADSLG